MASMPAPMRPPLLAHDPGTTRTRASGSLKGRWLGIAVLSGLAWWPQLALAWGRLGHEAVAAVAQELVQPATRMEIQRLLQSAATGAAPVENMASVANWADDIRREQPQTAPWHYDDIPLCAPVPPVRNWCDAPAQACASAQIELQRAVLADRTQPDVSRLQALKWIVHLVADIHQPLHASTDVYGAGQLDALAQTTDRGGNDVPVMLSGTWPDVHTNLHAAWDVDITEMALGHAADAHQLAGQLEPGDVTRLLALARSLHHDPIALDPLSWARESHNIARQVAYAFGASTAFACARPVTAAIALTPRYLAKAARVVRQRLALAALRLAATLDAALSPTTAPAATQP